MCSVAVGVRHFIRFAGTTPFWVRSFLRWNKVGLRNATFYLGEYVMMHLQIGADVRLSILFPDYVRSYPSDDVSVAVELWNSACI